MASVPFLWAKDESLGEFYVFRTPLLPDLPGQTTCLECTFLSHALLSLSGLPEKKLIKNIIDIKKQFLIKLGLSS